MRESKSEKKAHILDLFSRTEFLIVFEGVGSWHLGSRHGRSKRKGQEVGVQDRRVGCSAGTSVRVGEEVGSEQAQRGESSGEKVRRREKEGAPESYRMIKEASEPVEQ